MVVHKIPRIVACIFVPLLRVNYSSIQTRARACEVTNAVSNTCTGFAWICTACPLTLLIQLTRKSRAKSFNAEKQLLRDRILDFSARDKKGRKAKDRWSFCIFALLILVNLRVALFFNSTNLKRDPRWFSFDPVSGTENMPSTTDFSDHRF